MNVIFIYKGGELVAVVAGDIAKAEMAMMRGYIFLTPNTIQSLAGMRLEVK